MQARAAAYGVALGEARQGGEQRRGRCCTAWKTAKVETECLSSRAVGRRPSSVNRGP
jgi:hypothetical protein